MTSSLMVVSSGKSKLLLCGKNMGLFPLDFACYQGVIISLSSEVNEHLLYFEG